MKSITHGVKSAALSATIALLLAGGAGQAVASGTGSTDIYRDEFQTSFGLASQEGAPHAGAGAWTGSTDIYATRFQRVFGDAPSSPREASYSRANSGSTDVWGNEGFQRSFASAS